MFIDCAKNTGPALQRSAMFPAWHTRPVSVSLLWSEEVFLGARTINISSLQDEEHFLESCSRHKRLIVCFTEEDEFMYFQTDSVGYVTLKLLISYPGGEPTSAVPIQSSI